MDSKLKLNLTPEQNNEINKIVSLFHTSPALIERTVSYYLEYKSHLGNVPSHQILLAFKCAFFMAEKSEVMENLKGQKIRGIGLSLSNLIKSHKSEEAICMLRQLSKKVTIHDQQALNEIRNVVEEISLLVTFSDKFQKIITKLELKSINYNPNYQNVFTSFAWLLFVESKKTIFPHSQEIIENTCLLSHVISFMLIFGWNFIRSQHLIKSDPRLSENPSGKQVSLGVKNKIFDILKISNLNFYEKVAAEFEIFFNQKMQKNIIKHASNSSFLSPENIENNYKKLDHFYNKNIDVNGLDHRIFYKERSVNLTPSRFTPIYKGLNKGKIGLFGNMEKGRENLASHRVITFDNYDRNDVTDPKAPTYTEITKFPKNIMHSPSVSNIPLIQTPVSAGMDMYNYLNNKSKKYNEKNLIFESDQIVLEYIDKFFSKQRKAKTIEEIKKKLVFSLFKTYLVDFAESNPKDLCHEFQQALLAIILEIVCFVNNIHMEFSEVQNQLCLSTYYQWKVCDFLLKNDKSMPIPLKVHILDLEVSFVSEKIWLDDNLIHQIQTFFSSNQNDSPSKKKIQKLCARIIFQLAFQINQISNNLKIPEDFSEKVFQVLKNLLEQHIKIYQNRTLDQLVLCSFYLVAKFDKNSLTFGNFKEAYFEMNPQNAKDHQKLLMVNTPEYEDTPQLNLIQFYNSLFLAFAKNYLKQEKTVPLENYPYKNQNQAKLLLQSPLKTIIPKETNLYNKNLEANQGKNKAKALLTPQLYAYTESPLLKNQMVPLRPKVPMQSRKILDYEKEEAKILEKNVGTNYEKDEIHEPKPNIEDFASIKFKQTSTQKNNIQNISPRHLANTHSRKSSFAEQKPGVVKTGLFANIQAAMQTQQQMPSHLNLK